MRVYSGSSYSFSSSNKFLSITSQDITAFHKFCEPSTGSDAILRSLQEPNVTSLSKFKVFEIQSREDSLFASCLTILWNSDSLQRVSLPDNDTQVYMYVYGVQFRLCLEAHLSSRKTELTWKINYDLPECPPDVEAHRVQPEEGSQEEEVRHDR